MPALCARAGMDFSQIGVLQTNNRPKISPLCKGWHRFLRNLGILVKMLHEGLVWKISTGGASPLRGAGPWRSYSNVYLRLLKVTIEFLGCGMVSGWPNNWWPSLGWWVSNLGMMGEHPGDGGWASLGWWVSIFGMVGEHPCDGGWPSLGFWVYILWMVGDHDHTQDGGWLSMEWMVTILGIVGDFPSEVGVPPSLWCWVNINGMADEQWASWGWSINIVGMVDCHHGDGG